MNEDDEDWMKMNDIYITWMRANDIYSTLMWAIDIEICIVSRFNKKWQRDDREMTEMT